ncbi:MAG: biotin transporter BioY, partial [Pseudomonadota bacterium]
MQLNKNKIETPFQIWAHTLGIANRPVTVFLSIILGSALLIASAKLTIPLGTVPLSMQTLSVLMIGVVCGPYIGSSVIIAYLIQGAMGFPVFAGTPVKGIGIAYMMGPTGGYLIGFILAAFWSGLAYHKGWMSKISLSFLHLGFALS